MNAAREFITRCVLLVTATALAACSRHISDQEIASQIKAALYSDAELRATGLSITVHDGEVTLSGSLNRAGLQLRAFKLVYGTKGVNAIRDEIQISQSRPPVHLEATVKRLPANAATPSLLETPRPPFSDPEQPKQAEVPLIFLPEPPSSTLALSDPKPVAHANPAPSVAASMPYDSGMTTTLPVRLRNVRSWTRVPIRAGGIAGPAGIVGEWFKGGLRRNRGGSRHQKAYRWRTGRGDHRCLPQPRPVGEI